MGIECWPTEMIGRRECEALSPGKNKSLSHNNSDSQDSDGVDSTTV